MNKTPKLLISILIHLFLFSVLVTPALSLAAETGHGLIPCGSITVDKKPANPCGFDDLMTLVNRVINFILYYMAIPIAAIMFAYAGFLLVTAGGEAAHARTEAKSIFKNALIGLVLAAASWLIVKTLLSILGWNGSWIGF